MPPSPGILRRLAAMAYEFLLISALLAATLLIPHSFLGAFAHRLASPSVLWAQVFLTLLAYCVWFWSHGRQTLAMKTWHIRMVDRFGAPVSQPRALLRYVLSWLWFLPPLLAVAPFGLPVGEIAVLVIGWILVWSLSSRLHPQGQFWHDVLAGTRLIDSKPKALGKQDTPHV